MWDEGGIKLQVTTRENRRVCDWGICEEGRGQDGKKLGGEGKKVEER